MRPLLTWRFLLRRGWMLVLGAVLGTLAALAISGVAVSASSAYAVKSTEPFPPPFQTESLARTYARLIPEDPRVVAAIGAAVGEPEEDVRSHFSMTPQDDSNIVFARYTAKDAATAKLALRTLQRTLAVGSDGAGTRFARTIEPLYDPAVGGGFSRSKALLLGFLGGLVFAFVLALGLERRRPRIDRLDDLATVLPVPVSQAGEEQFTLSGSEGLNSAPAGQVLVRVEAVPDRRGASDRLLAAVPVEAVADRSGADPCVLVVERGAPAEGVEDVWAATLAAGFPVSAAYLVGPRFLRRRLAGAADGG